jgi:hypothetical protein
VGKRAVASVSDTDSLNPDPDILLNPDSDRIVIQAVAESRWGYGSEAEQGSHDKKKHFLLKNAIFLFLNLQMTSRFQEKPPSRQRNLQA